MTPTRIRIGIAVIALIACSRPPHDALGQTWWSMANINIAIEKWRVEGGAGCPALTELVAKHYLVGMPTDGWGQPLLLRCVGRDRYEIRSSGRDRQFNETDGDDLSSLASDAPSYASSARMSSREK
jgi:hypothetical protein